MQSNDQTINLKKVDCTWPRGLLHKMRFHFTQGFSSMLVGADHLNVHKCYPNEDPDSIESTQINPNKRVNALTVWTDRGKITCLSLSQSGEEKEIALRNVERLNMHARPHKVHIAPCLSIIGFYGKIERGVILQLGLLLWNPDTKALI